MPSYRRLVTVAVGVAFLGAAAAVWWGDGHALLRSLVTASLAVLAGVCVWLASRYGKAAQRLETALLFQRQLLERIPIPVFYKDQDCVYLGCNRSFEAFLGRDRGQIIGKTVFELAPPELARTYDGQDRELLGRRGVQVYTSKVEREGVRRNVVFHKATFDLPGGHLGGIIGAILDLSEQREAQDRAEALARELQVLLDTVPTGLMKLVDRRIVWANRAMEAMTGYSYGELIGKSTRFLYPSEERFLAMGRTIYTELAAGRMFRADEEMVRRDGSRMWVELSGMALAPDDLTRGTYWALDDVTARRSAEQRLAQEEERLREALRRNEETMAELRDALQKVRTLTGLLPICMHCHRIRDDKGNWGRIDQYISERTEASFTHGLCPECYEKHYHED
jgi:PAS domain S-box-containing protein